MKQQTGFGGFNPKKTPSYVPVLSCPWLCSKPRACKRNIYIYVYIYMYIYMYIYICVYICIYICTCWCSVGNDLPGVGNEPFRESLQGNHRRCLFRGPFSQFLSVLSSKGQSRVSIRGEPVRSALSGRVGRLHRCTAGSWRNLSEIDFCGVFTVGWSFLSGYPLLDPQNPPAGIWCFFFPGTTLKGNQKETRNFVGPRKRRQTPTWLLEGNLLGTGRTGSPDFPSKS